MKNEKVIEYEKLYKAVPPLARLSTDLKVDSEQFDAEDVVAQTGRYVFAPVLNSFVLYLLEDAINKGVKTLFFLARDAYFYYVIAERYVKQFNLNIQCKYLYVSRLSLRVPLYHMDINQALSYITLSGVDVTPAKVINRSGLPEEDKSQFITKIAKYLNIKEDEQIPRNRLGEVKSLLSDDKDFCQLLINKSKEEFSCALKYLEESGFGANEKIAIVDSGWVGSIQKSLGEFRKYLGQADELEGYYYGLYEIPDKAEEKYYHSFLFGPRSKLKNKVQFNNCLFECIFSAPHGMTLRYMKDEKVTPVLSTITQGQIDYLNKIETIVDRYLDQLFTSCSSFEEACGLFGNPTSRKAIENVLFSFMAKPSYEEAKAFGRMHFSDDVIDYNNAVLANNLSEKDLNENHFVRRVFIELKGMIFGKRHVVNISGWYEGSVMLYSKPSHIKYHLWAYKHYKYYLQYCKRKRWIRKREI
ncbi:hypothetical protein [Pseudobutyrivibrio ruminis]|uniref:hypothetical protein n=1 Tax=Pseudobutyrivibrio ruminis TaxID=46206 RepID=UPI0004223863|nr:hypothetical protein [Pseudobutyrivibrio ruminis]